MANEWVYLVNDRSPQWGYDVTPLEFMRGARRPGMHAWTLSRRLRQLDVGDYVWVRATRPLSAFIGLGQVAAEQREDAYGAVFGIRFDDERCRAMAQRPIPGVLEKLTQTTRLLTEGERRSLHRRAGALPATPPVPAGKVKRLQEVVARQGQADFRARLLVAYDSRCAISGTSVAEVLQAAHIEPYNGIPTNVVPNGLLLRADIHDLFDRGLIWVTANMTVGVSAQLAGTEYDSLQGRVVSLPSSVADRPARRRLASHRRVIAGQAR